MSDLNIDDPGSAESRSYSLPSPLMIAAVCTLAVVTLFIAVLDAEGQTIERPMAAVAPEVKFGSLRGSITNDERKAIGGVRVLIRRVHAGAANFHFDRVTAADGTFEVRSLLPGRYTIEIDPRTVPDAIFPAVPKLVFADVAAESGAEVALAVERDAQGVRRTARNRKK